MHIISDDDPLLRGARHVGKALTIGNLAALADDTAELHQRLAKLQANVVTLEAMARDGLAKVDARSLVADAINKIRAEDTKREASKARVLAWIKAQPNPAQYAMLARNNGIDPSELRP